MTFRAHRSAMVATVSAALLIAQQVAGKIARDSMFLSEHAGRALAYAMLASAVGSIVLAVWASKWMVRHHPARVLFTGLVCSAAAFIAEAALAHRAPALAAWVVFIHVGALGPVTVSGFWAAMNERFGTGEASRVFVWISSGATLGGVVGGIAAERIASMSSLPTLLLVLGIAGAASAAITFAWSRRIPQVDATMDAPTGKDSLALIAQKPALLRLGTVIALSATIATLLDFAMKSEAAAILPDRASLISFFSMFHALTGALAFVVSSAVSQRVMARFGMAGTLSLYPAAVLGAGSLAALSFQLSAMVLARSVETVLANSIFRSAYEILFSPLSPSLRRATKTVVDVVFFRAGDLLGSAGVIAAVALAGQLSVTVVLALAMAAAVLVLGFVRALGNDYVSALEERLARGLASSARLDAKAYVGAEGEAADLVRDCREYGVRLSKPLMETVLRATRCDDAELRDTALAYLHNTLPTDIREPWFAKHERRSRRAALVQTHAAPPEGLRAAVALAK